MWPKILSSRTKFFVFLVGIILVVGVISIFIPSSFLKSSTVRLAGNVINTSSPEYIRQGLPVHFQILAIGVNSTIEEVGLTSDGAMDVPKNISNVGWFNLGPRPGEIGTAVIDGHYGINKGKASAFDDLYKLRKGDKIDITDEGGKIISFIVSGNRRYDPKADATSVFNSSDGKSHLSLITCEGVWDEVSESYPTRLVVFADKE